MKQIVKKTTGVHESGEIAKKNILNPVVWDADKAITETEMVTSDKAAAIKELRIEKEGEIHRVFVQFTWRQGEYFLTTTRTSEKPREFKHFGRLIEYIEKTYPSIKSFEVQIKK